MTGFLLRLPLMVVLCLALAGGSAASAQTVSDSALDPNDYTDAHDLMGRFLGKGGSSRPDRDARQTSWLRIPFVTSNPGTGTLLGGGVEATFFRGDPSKTHASTVMTSLAASFSGSVVASVRLSLHGAGNRWILLGDNRFERMSQNSYGLGSSSLPSDRFMAGYTLPKVSDVALRRVYKGVYAGVGFHVSSHNNVEPVDTSAPEWVRSEYVQYSRENRFDPNGQGSSGVSVNLRFDNRDSSVAASRGEQLAASYRTYYRGFLGGDSKWQEVNLDLRGYRRLGTRHVLAVWAYSDLVTGGIAPYFDLPATGTDMQARSGRGYGIGRFRGEQLVYGEVEYRAALTENGLLGFVAFLNTTTVSDRSTGEKLFQSMAPGAGAGLRLLADKFSRTRICLDFGFGRNGSRGVYIALQEAF
jgi:hypothetical protein